MLSVCVCRTQANFTVSAVLGNAGEKASTGKHEAVLVYLQDWNGVRDRSFLYLLFVVDWTEMF